MAARARGSQPLPEANWPLRSLEMLVQTEGQVAWRSWRVDAWMRGREREERRKGDLRCILEVEDEWTEEVNTLKL